MIKFIIVTCLWLISCMETLKSGCDGCECAKTEDIDTCPCRSNCPQPGDCAFGDEYVCKYVKESQCIASESSDYLNVIKRCPNKCGLCGLEENVLKVATDRGKRKDGNGMMSHEPDNHQLHSVQQVPRIHMSCVDQYRGLCCDRDILCGRYDPRNCGHSLATWTGYFMRHMCCHTCHYKYHPHYTMHSF
ncbi:uncharacterized protein LOC142335186 [Convolutriloba macropyga]|uniref:uncharacterized protein LOC142335186 n=1 Tax=Convolutriloba macropyga TaxID=536237 RepID=UPI003F524B5D